MLKDIDCIISPFYSLRVPYMLVTETGRLAYSPSEAARQIGCSRPFIDRQISEGRLHATKVGGRVFVSLDALKAFLEGGLDK
jgi:excisionase family DNA binding protein